MSAPQHTTPSIDPDVAELVADLATPRARWLRIRRTGIGSSDVSALVGLSNYRSASELFLDKTGQLPEVDGAPSEAAEMGTLLEPVLAERFARVHGLTVTQVGAYRSQQHPHMMASPDRVCSDGAGLEIKTCSLWQAHQWAEGQTADHAELQAQWGMAVTELDRWHVAVLIGGQRNVYRTVARDDELIETLIDVSARFWREHVETRIPPEWGGTDADTALLSRRYQVAEDDLVDITSDTADEIRRERDKTEAAKKAAEADADVVKNRVRGLLGNAERLMSEQDEIATWKNTGPFSTKRLAEHYPDLAAQYTRTVSRDEVDTDALAADRPEVYRACRSRRLLFNT